MESTWTIFLGRVDMKIFTKFNVGPYALGTHQFEKLLGRANFSGGKKFQLNNFTFFMSAVSA